jgi:hypothetical protein
MGVRRVRGFFGALREKMLDAAGDESPLAVILTPGPFNETYFEHAYLARQLGMPLVEGSDLTVRGDTVFLKTLGGLRRVHSILRRLDDDFCDPLELRGDSALGVPGLIGALRAGRVVVSNALGTGVLESAAWLGFLPPVAGSSSAKSCCCRDCHLVARQPALECVLANLDRLVIKPTTRTSVSRPCSGLSLRARARSAERLRNVPMPMSLRNTCACRRRRCGNRDLRLGTRTDDPRGRGEAPRACACARSWRVTRRGSRRGVDAAWWRQDVWVLNENPHEDTLTSIQSGKWANLSAGTFLRAWSNLFWLGRYTCAAAPRRFCCNAGARSMHAYGHTRDRSARSRRDIRQLPKLRCCVHATLKGCRPT